jgi:hypothetical protein
MVGEPVPSSEKPTTQLSPASLLPPNKGKPKAFNCPHCGGVVTLKAVGLSVSAVCSHCGSIIDVNNENYRIIDASGQHDRDILIPLGTRGVLFDKSWEVIGYMERSNGAEFYEYFWEEYLLYNPYYGFRFLVQAEGHWNFMEVVRRDIAGVGGLDDLYPEGRLLGKRYKIFHTGVAVVHYVKGEFYWRVQKGEKTAVWDYICPPSLISAEKSLGELVVSQGGYVDPSTVKAAFNIPEMPVRRGVAPNQPDPYAHGLFWKIWFVALIAMVMAFFIHLITTSNAVKQEISYYTYTASAAQKEGELSSPVFTLPKTENVLVESYAPLDNDWLELTLSLVNTQTNETITALQGMEYYRGQDNDGAWAEGTRQRTTWFSAVPAGTYQILMDVDAGVFAQGRQTQFVVKVTRNVPSVQNFWVCILLILLYPLFTFLRWYMFENKRWSQSDFAPALYRASEGGGDDDDS